MKVVNTIALLGLTVLLIGMALNNEKMYIIGLGLILIGAVPLYINNTHKDIRAKRK